MKPHQASQPFFHRIFIAILIAALLLAAAPVQPALAADLGNQTPNASSPTNGSGFTNPNNGWLDDNTYATVTADNRQQQYLNFNIPTNAFPAGAVITGIEVAVRGRHSTNATRRSIEVQLSGNGGANWTALQDTGNFASGNNSNADQTRTVGTALDTWGKTGGWVPNEFTNANFRVLLTSNISSGTFSLDVVAIRVSYTIVHTITASAGTGGTITPSGAVVVADGGTQAFEIAPTAGYILTGVTVDGTNAGAIHSRTFTNVTADHTITATFNGGWFDPLANTNNGFTNAGDGYTSDNNRAAGNSSQDVIDYRVFDLTIPDNATITGVEVAVEGLTTGRDLNVSLSGNNGQNYTATKLINLTPNDPEKTFVVGGSADNWGRGWAADNFNNTNFRVRLQPTLVANTEVSIDQVQVKVHYVSATSLSVTPATGTYGGTTTLTATLLSGATGVANKSINFSLNGTSLGSATTNANGIASLSNVSLAGLNAGTYTAPAQGVSASFAGDSGFTASSGSANLTVNQAALTITANNASKSYGQVLTFAGMEFTASALVGSDSVTSVTLTSAGAAATAPVSGSPYSITPSAAVGNGLSNYNIEYVDGSLDITPITLTITANNASKSYGQVLTFAGTEFTTSALVGSDSVTSVTLTSAGAAATAPVSGSPYSITPSAAVGNGLSNYNIEYVDGSLDITPITLTITANNASKSYGQQLTFAGTEFTTSALVGSDSVTSVTLTSAGAAATAPVSGSPYSITPSAAIGNGLSNYNIEYVDGTLNITSALLTVTADPQAITYGDPDPAFTFQYSGFAGVDDATVLTSEPTCSVNGVHANAGDYTITCSGGSDDNYSFQYNDNTLTVNPLAITVSAVADIKEYDGNTSSTGIPNILGTLVGDDTPAFSQAFENASAGTGKTLLPTGSVLDGNNGNNYAINFVNNTSGEITRRPITVSADPQSKPFGGSDPALTYSVTDGSLLGNDGFSGALTRDPGETVGVYTIRQGDLSAGNNYALSFVENTLTITIVNQTITIINGAPATAVNGSSFNVQASASSNLDVTITVEGFCTGSGLNSATITMNTGVGICTIHYNQGGNENFNPAVEKTETTAGIEGPLVTLHPANALVMTGGTASFSAAASGNPAPSVVWQVSSDNGVTYTDLGTETNTILTVTAQASDHGKKYRAVFTNSAGSATTDPATLTIDDSAPTVITGGINSVPDTGDAKIDELEIVTVGLTKLLVTFSEDVNNSEEGLGKHDVTNPANYLLVKDNGDGIQTVSCSAGIAGNDLPITVDSVTYTNNNGNGPFVASLTLNGGNILSNGVYRLLVCGSTSITDLAGNHLAGNGSTPSTDFPRSFVMATTETGSGGGGGSGSGGSSNGKKSSPSYSGVLIPVTGFAPSQASFLPVQPLNLSYAPYSGLIIEIPSLGVKVDIVGVPNVNDGWDVTWLGNNAGYLSGSAFPTTSGNSVITAHVWNANNTAGTFFNLKSLKYGDKILIHAWGKVYTYEVRSQTKLQPTDLATVMSHEELSWVTLVTCENYSEKSDKYVYRRVVKAVLVSVTDDK